MPAATLQLHEEQVSPTVLLISEEPRHRLIHYYNQDFYLPIPWVHYKITIWTRPSDSAQMYYLGNVYFSRQSLTESRFVSFPFLPNFYGSHPCHHSLFDSDVLIHKYGHITAFWHGKFTRDGHISKTPAWRELAFAAGHPVAKRREILSYWETRDMDYIMKLPFPKSAQL